MEEPLSAPRCRAPTLALLAASVVAFGAACGGRGEPGQPEPPPPPLDLTGSRVMLLPVQAPAPAGLDAELAFWLNERAAQTEWLLPAELQDLADRSPAWRVRLDALPGGVSGEGSRRRVHDPLYGHLRRLGAQTDARLALLPFSRNVTIRPAQPAAPGADTGARGGAGGIGVEMSAILVDVVGGRVVWMGSVRLPPAADGRPPSPAAAAEALARALLL